MSLPKLATPSTSHLLLAWHYRPAFLCPTIPANRAFSSTTPYHEQHAEPQHRQPASRPPPHPPPTSPSPSPSTSPSSSSTNSTSRTVSAAAAASSNHSPLTDWEDSASLNSITHFSQLPHRSFGYNQHIRVNEHFKEALRQILWQFRAPIRYAFAYGSGVFSQTPSASADPGGGAGGGGGGYSPHPNPPKAVEEWQKGGAKIIDFIFGVSHTQHWHSLNLAQHPDHYSGLRYLPYSSAAISHIQDDFGAGVYFNPYITVNGTMIKYGVVNLDTLSADLSEWRTLYLAGRLQKPVKILRDDPRVRLANQVNLISALRTALLMLPESFSERELYERIASLSYLGDPRMNSYLGGENPRKVSNIVGAQLPSFRQLYVPLIDTLPNIAFSDPRTPRDEGWEKEDARLHPTSAPRMDDVLGAPEGLSLQQDLDPQKRGNMVRRLPAAFRRKLYWHFKKKFLIPGSAFDAVLEESQDDDPARFKRRQGGHFERRIAADPHLPDVVGKCVRGTVAWPSTSQTIKGAFTAGLGRSWRYYSEKRRKSRERPGGGGGGGGGSGAAAAATAAATVRGGEGEAQAKKRA